MPDKKNELAPLTSAQLAKTVDRWGSLQSILESPQLQSEMAKVVTKTMTPERLAKLAFTAMKTAEKAEKFLQCTGQSVVTAMMDMATTGLDPTKALGQCCLIPYGKDCTFQVEYRGFIHLAANSGKIAYITADKVRDGDLFDWMRGTEQYLRHRAQAPAGAPVTHYYAVVKFKDGSSDFRVMTTEEVEAHRQKYSKLPQGPAWKNSFDAMAMKTAIRQLCKLLSLSPQMVKATLIDEYREAGIKNVPAEVIGTKPPELQEGSFSFGKDAFTRPPASLPEPADEPEEPPADPEPPPADEPPQEPQDEPPADEEAQTPDPLDNAVLPPKEKLIAQIVDIVQAKDLDMSQVKKYIRTTYKKPSSALCTVKQLGDMVSLLVNTPELFAKD